MKPVVAYHSSDSETLQPRPMLHVGTLAQARMRGGRHLHRVVIRTGMRVPACGTRDHGTRAP